eukprot:gene26819-32965_t
MASFSDKDDEEEVSKQVTGDMASFSDKDDEEEVSNPGLGQKGLPLTFALFFLGDATKKNGDWLHAVLTNIRKYHTNKQRFPIVILTDEGLTIIQKKTKFRPMPSSLGVELRRQPRDENSANHGYRYLYRAMAERSVLAHALNTGRPTHVMFLDATDIIVTGPLLPLFKEQKGQEFALGLTYRPPRGRASKGSLAAIQPVNLGVKAVHGWALQKGIEMYSTFIETYKQNYILQNKTYGLNEQQSIMDVLKRSSDFSNKAMMNNERMRWKVPRMDVTGPIAADPSRNKDFLQCQPKSKSHVPKAKVCADMK